MLTLFKDFAVASTCLMFFASKLNTGKNQLKWHYYSHAFFSVVCYFCLLLADAAFSTPENDCLFSCPVGLNYFDFASRYIWPFISAGLNQVVYRNNVAYLSFPLY